MTVATHTPRYSVGVRRERGWKWHSDHTAATDALNVAASLRAQGTEARAFDWAGDGPAGTMLDTEPGREA